MKEKRMKAKKIISETKQRQFLLCNMPRTLIRSILTTEFIKAEDSGLPLCHRVKIGFGTHLTAHPQRSAFLESKGAVEWGYALNST